MSDEKAKARPEDWIPEVWIDFTDFPAGVRVRMRHLATKEEDCRFLSELRDILMKTPSVKGDDFDMAITFCGEEQDIARTLGQLVRQ